MRLVSNIKAITDAVDSVTKSREGKPNDRSIVGGKRCPLQSHLGMVPASNRHKCVVAMNSVEWPKRMGML